MGTIDNIFVLHSLINHFVNNNKTLFCAFVDFSKADDIVVRDNLWYKLIHIGIRGEMLNIIRSMYSCTKSFVKACNNQSEPFVCNLGVRQGECLSPFLFAMYINDLEDEIIHKGVGGVDIGMLKLFILLYADDIFLLAENELDMQNYLDALYEYSMKWRLCVNIEKTKIKIFRKGGRLSNNLDFKYSNNPIEIVRRFSYLGVVFTTGGSFTNLQNTLVSNAKVFKSICFVKAFSCI